MIRILHHLFLQVKMYYTTRPIQPIPLGYEVYIRSCRISTINSMSALKSDKLPWRPRRLPKTGLPSKEVHGMHRCHAEAIGFGSVRKSASKPRRFACKTCEPLNPHNPDKSRPFLATCGSGQDQEGVAARRHVGLGGRSLGQPHPCGLDDLEPFLSLAGSASSWRPSLSTRPFEDSIQSVIHAFGARYGENSGVWRSLHWVPIYLYYGGIAHAWVLVCFCLMMAWLPRCGGHLL